MSQILYDAIIRKLGKKEVLRRVEENRLLVVKMAGLAVAQRSHKLPGQGSGCRPQSQSEREKVFWSDVSIRSSGCWEKTGRTRKDGYVNFWFDEKTQLSHRVAWILTFGKIPNGAFALHRCDNRKCVRLDHLFLGSQKQNMEDMVSKGRAAKFKIAVRGENNGMSKLSNSDAVKIRSEYATGGRSQQSIADNYGVSQKAISLLITGENWKYTK